MRTALAATLLILLLGGCATPVEGTRPDEVWAFSADVPDRATLVLGVPATDDLRLLLACRPRSGAVEITVVGRQGDPAVVELHSGEVWNRYTGAGHADEETLGGLDIDLKLAADDPVLRRFADTGEFSVVFPGARTVRLPNAFAPAHDFLKTCRLPT